MIINNMLFMMPWKYDFEEKGKQFCCIMQPENHDASNLWMKEKSNGKEIFNFRPNSLIKFSTDYGW